MSLVARIFVQRDGRSLDDLTLCQRDQVKCDGWQYVWDRELVYAERLLPAQNPIAMFGLHGRAGDWVVIHGHGALPEIYSDGDFRRLYEQAGLYDGKPLFRRTERVRAFCWRGDGVIRLYENAEPTGLNFPVRQGDWVVAGEAGGYRRVSREIGALYFEPESKI